MLKKVKDLLTKLYRIIVVFIGKNKDKYLKPWIFSSDDPDRIKVPYVMAVVFFYLFFTAVTLEVKFQYGLSRAFILSGGNPILKPNFIPIVTVLMGAFGGVMAIYNWGKKK